VGLFHAHGIASTAAASAIARPPVRIGHLEQVVTNRDDLRKPAASSAADHLASASVDGP
jgi:hypothetical protein